LSEFGHSIK